MVAHSNTHSNTQSNTHMSTHTHIFCSSSVLSFVARVSTLHSTTPHPTTHTCTHPFLPFSTTTSTSTITCYRLHTSHPRLQDQLAACTGLYVEDQLGVHFRALLDYVKRAEQAARRGSVPEGQPIPGA